MAQATGSFSTYDAVGNREDLSDMIFDVSPSETPFLSAIKKKKATATNHEWQTDTLTAAAAENKHIEGDDATPVAPGASVRLGNYTQILKKHAVIPGTQEAVKSAGRKSEMAYQVARRLKEIKTDMEKSMIGGNALGVIKAAGSDTVARRMADIYTYLTSNVDFPAGAAVSSGDGTDLLTAGTADRDLTEALLTNMLSDCFDNGGNPKLLCVSSTNKGVVSTFTGGGTRYVDTDNKQLVNSIDVYVGDYHTLKVVPCRQIIGDNVLAVDPEYMAIAELRSVSAKDLAVTGDSIRKEITWEATLEVCNEAAHGLVTDTNG